MALAPIGERHPIDDQDFQHIVKFENLHRFDFDPSNGGPTLNNAFLDQTRKIDTNFERLHERAKTTLGN